MRVGNKSLAGESLLASILAASMDLKRFLTVYSGISGQIKPLQLVAQGLRRTHASEPQWRVWDFCFSISELSELDFESGSQL